MVTFADSHRDLLEAEVGSLSTIGSDGFPQVSGVWFLLDADGKLKLSLNTTRQKTKNLQVRPQCTLLISDAENPYRYLEIRARALVEHDDDYEFADKVGRKYGTDLRTRDEPGETRVVVTLDPVRVRAVQLR
jgi:PPOX class probable F420-dependent enzyme